MKSLCSRRARILLLVSYLLLMLAPDLHHHHTIHGHYHEQSWHKHLDPCPVETLTQAHGDTVIPLIETAPRLYYAPLPEAEFSKAGCELPRAASARAPPLSYLT